MWLNQTLLLLSVLSLHTGFGLILGFLLRQSRLSGHPLKWGLAAIAFFSLINFPSSLVILGLDELNVASRSLAWMFGFIAALMPLFRFRWVSNLLNSPTLRKLYPAASMLLLASWSTILFVQDGTAAAAPLALSATIAGIAALQYRPQPR
jgi:hypothetical protein